VFKTVNSLKINDEPHLDFPVSQVLLNKCVKPASRFVERRDLTIAQTYNLLQVRLECLEVKLIFVFRFHVFQ